MQHALHGRKLIAALALAALAGIPAATSALAEARAGQPAPTFTAKDTGGKDVSLEGLKGKTVVLEWTNHLCPYTVKHYASGNMQALQKDATGKGVVWLTVASSAKGEQGHIGPAEADKLTTERNAAPSAVLLDHAGTMARLYGARVTPHMYVIDPKGTLVYAGAIDDRPTSSQADVKGARNYVREALQAVAEGKPVPTDSTRPYGCTVKLAPPARS
jgi:peroxiredoxin